MINNNSNVSANELSLIITGVVSGIGFVIIVIFVVLKCVCCKKPQNTSPSNGIYKDSNSKNPAQRRPMSNRFHNLRSRPNPDVYELQYANHIRFPIDQVPGGHRNFAKNSKQPRILEQTGPAAVASVPHRALPAPPSSTGTPYSESLTRESSTSELYASVDKNPQADPVINPNSTVASLNNYNDKLKQNLPSCSAANVSHCQAHLYAKICDDHHVYSKIWSSTAPGANGGAYDNVNAAEDSDFDPFYSRVNENANARSSNRVLPQQRLMKQLHNHHHAYEYPVFTPKQNGPIIGGAKELLISDPLYSKIGSEDPYSSIKSEEHYSRVEREDSLSIEADDVCDGPSTSTLVRGKPDVYDEVYFRYARPGRSTKPSVFRRYSDGDEYALVRKGSAGLYSSPARRVPPPPVPEKQFSRAVDEVDAHAVVESKKEPSYRYITVRESLDALRERMEQQQRPLVSNYVALSDPSLHYYSTISEHSYEVVPSRVVGGQNTPAHPTYDDTMYIDQDDLLDSIRDVRAGVSVGQDLNSTSHSDEMTIKGSHVTLVQVEAVLNCNKSNSSDVGEPARPSSVPPPPSSSSTAYHRFNYDYDNINLHNRNHNPSTLNSFIVQQNNSRSSTSAASSSSCVPKNQRIEQNFLQKSSVLFQRDDREINETPFFESKTCRNDGVCESKRRSDVDPEYPTTFCFCHPSTGSKKIPVVNGKKRPPDDKHKRDRHF